MPAPERQPLTAESGSGFYLALGAVVVAALVGGYVLMGAPGLHQPVAQAPGLPANSQPTDVAQQPAPIPPSSSVR